MSSLAYELVCNPEIQQKLFEEIQGCENELNGAKVSYEKIQNLKYLDQCISETLRKWTVAPVSLQTPQSFRSFVVIIYLFPDDRTSVCKRL